MKSAAIASRQPLIDALKALAAQIVLLHHFVSYGPLAALIKETMPDLHTWLFDYGRMAVQVFLVCGGYLAARSLSPTRQGLPVHIGHLLFKRYLRLSLPFMVAICFAIAGSAIARLGMNDPAIPAPAQAGQWFAHLALMHGVLGTDALSTGVWYVAIDFQLFALFAFMLWLARDERQHLESGLALTLVLLFGLAALFVFNLNPDWDNWGIYFFGSYALGILVYWLERQPGRLGWLALMTAVVALALVLEFRTRIALALTVALLLAYAQTRKTALPGTAHPLVAYLSRTSYALFLLHFPIYLMVSALWLQMDWLQGFGLISGVLTAWTLSMLTADVFHRHIEQPASRLEPSQLGQQLRRLLPA